MARTHLTPDGTRVALSSNIGQIYIFDLASASLMSTYTSHTMSIRTLSWSSDSNVSPLVTTLSLRSFC